MPKPLTYREMLKRLRKHDKNFGEAKRKRGKGSHRVLCRRDQPGHYAVKCHGEGTSLGKGTLRAIIRRFDLPSDIFD